MIIDDDRVSLQVLRGWTLILTKRNFPFWKYFFTLRFLFMVCLKVCNDWRYSNKNKIYKLLK